MAKILIDYDALEQAEKKISQHKENFDTMIGDLTSTINKLNGQWEGTAKNEFDAQFESLKPQLKKFAELLGNYAVALNNTVQAGQNVDIDAGKNIGDTLNFH